MVNGLVSVIVPVYNCEKYLSACVDSILSQKYKKIEVLLIDDGTKDRAGEICDKYAETDERVKVIHRENRGVSDDVEYIDFKDTVYDKAKLKNEQIKFKKYLDDCFLDNNER